MRPAPTEADYVEGARLALDKQDMRVALEQIAGALSFRPLAPEHRALLDLILARTPRPLELLPQRGDAFYGVAAVRAWVLARNGHVNEAILQLLDVAHFRPNIPYLVWVSEWRAEHGLRGVAADAVATACGRFLAAVDRDGEGEGAIDNLEAALGLLEELRRVRPKALASLVTIEAMALRRLDRAADAVSLVAEVLPVTKSSALLVQQALALAAMGELERSVDAMRDACRATPGDAALQADLADALLLSGRFAEADKGYATLASDEDEQLRAHSELARSYIACLLTPADEALWHAGAMKAGPAGKRGRELVPLFSLYRSELPAVEDPLAGALMDVLSRVRSAPPKGHVRLRVKLDGEVPATARAVFDAGLAELGLTGSIDNDGRDVPRPRVATEIGAAILARVRNLAATPLDIDAWCAFDEGISLAEGRAAFDRPCGSASDPIADLDRQRLAALALTAAGADASAMVPWLSDLASGDDGWEARPALMVLAALARSRPSLRSTVRAAFEAAEAKSDARGTTLLGCWCLLPDLDPIERGARYQAWQKARIRR